MGESKTWREVEDFENEGGTYTFTGTMEGQTGGDQFTVHHMAGMLVQGPDAAGNLTITWPEGESPSWEQQNPPN